MHLDVRAPNELPGDREARTDAFTEKIVRLGGTKMRTVKDDTDYFAVMQDPEGNEFCIGTRDDA